MKTEEIQDLNAFCIGKNDNISYYDANSNKIVTLKDNACQDKEMFCFKKDKQENQAPGGDEVSAIGTHPNGNTMILGHGDGSVVFVDPDTFKKKYEV